MKNMTQTAIVKWLNDKFKKKTGRAFTTGDVQGYIRRKQLPKYLGGSRISSSNVANGVKLYNIL